MRFYDAGRRERRLRARHRAGAARHARQPEVRASASSATPRRSRRPAVSRQRPRAGVAAVVLPVEQHPRRRAARRGGEGQAAARPAVLDGAGAADAGRPARRRRWSTTSPASGCTCATCAARRRPERLPGFRRQPAAGVRARDSSCSSAASSREDRSVLDLLTADYTFVNERLARHYGIPNVYGSALPPRAADRRARGAGCSARAASCW